jgi:CspA family cold shock protein
MEGKVKWFNTQKGYGFIEGDDGTDYFVHYKALPEGVASLDEGQRVSFEAVETDKGKQAQDISLSAGEAPAEEAPEEEAPEEEAPAEEPKEE